MFAVLFLLVRIIFKAFSKASNTFCLRIGEFYVSTETFLFEGRWEGSPNFWMGNFVFPSLNSTILSSPYQIFQYPVFTKRPHAPALKRGRCWANPWLEKNASPWVPFSCCCPCGVSDSHTHTLFDVSFFYKNHFWRRADFVPMVFGKDMRVCGV